MSNLLVFPPDDPFGNYNVTTNTFYLTFWQTGVPGSFISLVAVRWAIAMVGFLLNLALSVVAIYNRRSLNGSCNCLIAVNAMFTALFELSLTISLVMQLTGPKVSTLRTCFFIQLLPIICRNMIISTLFMIAIDRLVSVLFVLWHIQNEQSPFYKAGLISFCIGHALFFVAFCASMAVQMPELRVICFSSDDCYQGDGQQTLFLVNTIILVLLLLAYAFIWAFIQMRGNTAELKSTKRIIKSLTLTAIIISVGWLSYNAIQAVVLPSMSQWLHPVATAYLTFGFSILPYIAMAMNAPMYFYFSKDYHNAFLKTFRFLMAGVVPKGVSQNQVVPTKNVMFNNNSLVTVTQKHAPGNANFDTAQ